MYKMHSLNLKGACQCRAFMFYSIFIKNPKLVFSSWWQSGPNGGFRWQWWTSRPMFRQKILHCLAQPCQFHSTTDQKQNYKMDQLFNFFTELHNAKYVVFWKPSNFETYFSFTVIEKLGTTVKTGFNLKAQQETVFIWVIPVIRILAG